MNDEPKRGLFVFGAGGVTGVIALAALTLVPDETFGQLAWGFRVYWAGVVFLLAMFAAMIWITWPSVITERQWHTTARAKLVYEATHLGGMSEASVIENSTDKREEKWRGWLVGHLEAIRDGRETGPHYSHGLDAVMDYALWRKAFANPLVSLGILSEITERQRTVWMAGYDAATAIGAVKVAHPLPHVVEFDPPTAQQENTA